MLCICCLYCSYLDLLSHLKLSPASRSLCLLYPLPKRLPLALPYLTSFHLGLSSVTASKNLSLIALISECQCSYLVIRYSLPLLLFETILLFFCILTNDGNCTITYTLRELNPYLKWFTAVFSAPRTMRGPYGWFSINTLLVNKVTSCHFD